MSDKIEKSAEEVTVTRKSNDPDLDKRSTDLLRNLIKNEYLPENPKEGIDEIIRTMRHPPTGLDRQKSKELKERLGELVVNTQIASIKAQGSHIQDLIKMTTDMRKIKLLGIWMDFIRNEGVKTMDKLNKFLGEWMTYSQNEEEEAERTGLTPERKQILIRGIKKNENRLIEDVNDMIDSFWRENKEHEEKVKDILKSSS